MTIDFDDIKAIIDDKLKSEEQKISDIIYCLSKNIAFEDKVLAFLSGKLKSRRKFVAEANYLANELETKTKMVELALNNKDYGVAKDYVKNSSNFINNFQKENYSFIKLNKSFD
jgi:histidinol phosphatase-like enzyme